MTTQELHNKMIKAQEEGKLQDAMMYRDLLDAQLAQHRQPRTEWTPESIKASA